MSKDPDYWEHQLRRAGLSARRDEEWRNVRQVSLQAMPFHDQSLAHRDRYCWDQESNGLDGLKSAIPADIRSVAEMDHCRRTRKEQQKLDEWSRMLG